MDYYTKKIKESDPLGRLRGIYTDKGITDTNTKKRGGMVWWAFPVAEAVSLAVSIMFFVRLYKTELRESV